MNFNIAQNLVNEIHSIQLMVVVLNAILHVLFAGAVARDAGALAKLGIHTRLVSSVTWAIATLLGGPLVAGAYWFIHHLKSNP